MTALALWRPAHPAPPAEAMDIDFSKNHFELFGLEPAFRLDPARLEQGYRDIQSLVHPDRFAHLSEAERRVSMQWATHANEAYQTLRVPISRARYLLRLNGIETREETNTAMSSQFLVAQMEWREAVMEANTARDADSLFHLEARLQHEIAALHDHLARSLDDERNYAAAAESVRKLKFLEKLQHEIGDALEALEG